MIVLKLLSYVESFIDVNKMLKEFVKNVIVSWWKWKV